MNKGARVVGISLVVLVVAIIALAMNGDRLYHWLLALHGQQ